MAATSLDWSAIDAESLEPHELTPEPDDDHVGIGLAAPRRVVRGERLFLSGFIALGGGEALRPGIWPHALTFVASAARWCASGQKVDESSPAEPTARAPVAVDPAYRATEYFTFDLVDLLDKPIPLGRLYVYAFLGNHVSNVVTVDVVEPEEAAADEEDDD